MTLTTDQHEKLRTMVDREVYYCVSGLVDHFAKHPHALDGSGYDYDELMELYTPEPDYEEALRQSGYVVEPDSDGNLYAYDNNEDLDVDSDLTFDKWLEEHGTVLSTEDPDDLQAICEELAINVDDYRNEVYEHWIVSTWLANRLRDQGEAVGDLLGLTIWGRCTTGQAIYIDSVMERIARYAGLLE